MLANRYPTDGVSDLISYIIIKNLIFFFAGVDFWIMFALSGLVAILAFLNLSETVLLLFLIPMVFYLT